MKNIFLALSLTLLAGCASSTPNAEAPTAEKPQSGATTGDNDSQVLSTKKKCPKHSHLVNGKCTLDVESDD